MSLSQTETAAVVLFYAKTKKMGSGEEKNLAAGSPDTQKNITLKSCQIKFRYTQFFSGLVMFLPHGLYIGASDIHSPVTTREVRFTDVDSVENNQPSTGMSFNIGIPELERTTEDFFKPPMTKLFLP